MLRATLLFAFSGLAATLGACERTESASPARGVAPIATTADAGTATPTSTTSPLAPAGPSASKRTTPARGARTQVPTQDEWRSGRAVAIDGASALGCEALLVREWLRVSCRANSETGAEPTSVSLERWNEPGATAFVAPGVTSLVVPFEPSTDVVALFFWSERAMRLTLRWFPSEAQPEPIARFEATTLPGVMSPAKIRERMCRCLGLAAKCSEAELGPRGGASADCARAVTCRQFVECSSGEPTGAPVCLPGYRATPPPFASCVRDCSRGQQCPPSERCAPDEAWSLGAYCQ